MHLKKSYHHGALRDALVDQALVMIEETGLEGLSLRKLAARLGVSHAAPEHHFPSLKHLFTAMAAIGFARFTAAMAGERARSDSDPVEQLRAALRGYLAFATGQPALFRLMFTASLLDWSNAALEENAAAGYRQLQEICAPAAERLGLTTDAERSSLEHMVWSYAHGQAHLMIDQKLPVDEAGQCRPVPQAFDFATMVFSLPPA